MQCSAAQCTVDHLLQSLLQFVALVPGGISHFPLKFVGRFVIPSVSLGNLVSVVFHVPERGAVCANLVSNV